MNYIMSYRNAIIIPQSGFIKTKDISFLRVSLDACAVFLFPQNKYNKQNVYFEDECFLFIQWVPKAMVLYGIDIMNT